jgi:sigma-B regulation protein RsbU (phosphoserine phosphatase)
VSLAPADENLRRSAPDRLDAVPEVLRWVEASLERAGAADHLMGPVVDCLEEALANLIRHGEPRDDAKSIEIELWPSDAAVVAVVRDQCLPFDITDEKPHAAARPPGADLTDRGLGRIRRLSSGLAYRAGPPVNELRMTFRGPPDAATLEGWVAEVGKIPAFKRTPAHTIADLVRACHQLEFHPGQRLLAQGEVSEFSLIVLEGDVAVVNENQHGETPLALFSGPALIGEIGALTLQRRTATVRAMGHVQALRVEKEALLDAGRASPEMLVSIIGQLGHQIQSVNQALGLYAAGLSALERDDFDPAVLDDLTKPTAELGSFAAAFRRLANRVSVERRTRGEMASAALIQQSMLPRPLEPSELAGRCDVAGRMKPARDVGGDLFDIFMLDENRLGLVVGDVCGKGVPASLFMCVTVTALRSAAQQHRDLSQVINQANRLLCAQNEMSMFSTVFYGVLDLAERRLQYVNCGHNAPYVLGPGGASYSLGGRGPPLGLFPEAEWTSLEIPLIPGAGVFIFSDGVTEAVNPLDEEYGDRRLETCLRARGRKGAEKLIEAVMKDVEAFADGCEQFDDITCVAALLR